MIKHEPSAKCHALWRALFGLMQTTCDFAAPEHFPALRLPETTLRHAYCNTPLTAPRDGPLCPPHSAPMAPCAPPHSARCPPCGPPMAPSMATSIAPSMAALCPGPQWPPCAPPHSAPMAPCAPPHSAPMAPVCPHSLLLFLVAFGQCSRAIK